MASPFRMFGNCAVLCCQIKTPYAAAAAAAAHVEPHFSLGTRFVSAIFFLGGVFGLPRSSPDGWVFQIHGAMSFCKKGCLRIWAEQAHFRDRPTDHDRLVINRDEASQERYGDH